MFKQLLLISSLLYAVYSWYRRFRARSTLVDGPYPPSWLYGHLDEIKGLNGVGFQYQLMRQYKGVARLYGLLGAQSHIFISDPSALRQVLISKKELFTEGSIFISLNSVLFGKDAMTTKQGPVNLVILNSGQTYCLDFQGSSTETSDVSWLRHLQSHLLNPYPQEFSRSRTWLWIK